MDLQEWLRLPVLIERNPATSAERRLTAKEVITDTTHCLGPAHYDESVSEMLEAMQAMGSRYQDQVIEFLLNAGDVVQRMSDWVLAELSRRGVLP
jgi:hypothetical protein